MKRKRLKEVLEIIQMIGVIITAELTLAILFLGG